MFWTSYQYADPSLGALVTTYASGDANGAAWRLADMIVTAPGSPWEHVTSAEPTPAALRTHAGTLGSGSSGRTTDAYAAIYDASDAALPGGARVLRFRVGSFAEPLQVHCDMLDAAVSSAAWAIASRAGSNSGEDYSAVNADSRSAYTTVRTHVAMDDAALVIWTSGTEPVPSGSAVVALLSPPADGHVARVSYATLAGCNVSMLGAGVVATGLELRHPAGGPAFGSASVARAALKAPVPMPTASDVQGREVALAPVGSVSSGATWGYHGGTSLVRLMRPGAAALGATTLLDGRRYVCISALSGLPCILVAIEAPA